MLEQEYIRGDIEAEKWGDAYFVRKEDGWKSIAKENLTEERISPITWNKIRDISVKEKSSPPPKKEKKRKYHTSEDTKAQ